MHENEIAKIVVDACYHTHKQLGPGLLETVYEVILSHELKAWFTSPATSSHLCEMGKYHLFGCRGQSYC